jgi:two-component system sensor histidine kinase GlrK
MKRLRVFYPNSFLKLLSIGFVLTILPLLFAFANAALYLDRLADQSHKTVRRAVEATRASRVLTEQLTVIERGTRQYLVLGDTTLLESFQGAHEKFGATVNELAQLPLDTTLRTQLNELSKRENSLYQNVMSGSALQNPEAVVTEFFHLSELAKTILDANNRLIDRESSILVATAERAQHMLLWQTLPLIPIAILVAVAITFLLTRPIRRMDVAIRRLGRGEYNDPIEIEGPRDLRRLGERLEWLRVQLCDLEEQKKRFLRNVSHELKTPLTSIREGSELLTEEVGGTLSPQQREIASILHENSLRLQKMIENLLYYTAVQYQKPVLQVERIELKPLIEEAISSYTLTIDTKNLTVVPALIDLSLEGDREQLLTVFDNLISNAIKYTPRGGSVTIRLAREHDKAILEVSDSGPGITLSDRDRLFEPFYRGSGTYDSHISGSGLGLSIAREYVEAHGGKISLMPSEKGACFRITLPFLQQTNT